MTWQFWLAIGLLLLRDAAWFRDAGRAHQPGAGAPAARLRSAASLAASRALRRATGSKAPAPPLTTQLRHRAALQEPPAAAG
jgi:hypothetical protein